MQANIKVGQADPSDLVHTVRDRDVDVLTVQELTDESIAGLHAAGLDDLLPHRFVVSYGPGGEGGGIYSRFPLSNTRNLEGFLSANLSADLDVGLREPLALFAVHPAPAYLFPAQMWAKELRELHSELEASAPRDNVLVSGDFNATYTQRQYRALLTDGYADAADQVGAGLLPTMPADRGIPPLIGIDRMITKGAVATSLEADPHRRLRPLRARRRHSTDESGCYSEHPVAEEPRRVGHREAVRFDRVGLVTTDRRQSARVVADHEVGVLSERARRRVQRDVAGLRDVAGVDGPEAPDRFVVLLQRVDPGIRHDPEFGFDNGSPTWRSVQLTKSAHHDSSAPSEYFVPDGCASNSVRTTSTIRACVESRAEPSTAGKDRSSVPTMAPPRHGAHHATPAATRITAASAAAPSDRRRRASPPEPSNSVIAPPLRSVPSRQGRPAGGVDDQPKRPEM
ncbi:endonuclease/exonuclease/phosphatase family protein [Prescottella defluvii]|nr:endonuclease/exonuclease/phosphatase family protein [Prescottella defluvii]